MKAYSIPALIIGVICLTIALSDSLAWVNRNKKNRDIAFILVCFGGALFCFCCAGEYSVDFPVQSLFWLKGEVIASTISGFALIWYIAETTHLIDRWILMLGLAWAVLSVVSQLVDLGDLTWVVSRPLVLRVNLPFGLDFVYQEVGRGIILVIIALGGFAFQLYLLSVVVRFRLSGNRRESLVLFGAVGFIIFAQVIDFFIGIGLLSFVFLLEYAWLATILIVGINRSNDFIEAAFTRKVLAKTGEELLVSQVTLSSIIDSTQDLIWSVDAENLGLLTFNQPFRDYFSRDGWRTVQAGGAFMELLDSAAEREHWLGLFRQALAKGSSIVEYSPPGRQEVYLVGINQLKRETAVFGLSVFAHDITDRKKAEEQLRQALSEKEVLLREIHHRTKNNMNVIISILKLQANQMGDQELKDAFAVSIDRIIAMSLVHSRLYQASDLARINLKDYLQELAQRLLSIHSLPNQRPTLVYDLEAVFVMIDAAMHCGMILNELITNALKHAFSGVSSGQITIRLRRDQASNIELSIGDNGSGLPIGFDPKSDGNLGFRLIRTLAQDSLHGQLEFGSAAGFSCSLKFSVM